MLHNNMMAKQFLACCAIFLDVNRENNHGIYSSGQTHTCTLAVARNPFCEHYNL